MGRAFIAISMLIYGSLLAAPAKAQSEWIPVLESHLSALEDTWPLSIYVRRSVRNVRIVDAIPGSVVVSARYDYRTGDSTLSDTVYMTFNESGQRICVAYRFYNRYCTIYGAEREGSP